MLSALQVVEGVALPLVLVVEVEQVDFLTVGLM
jgi:hypothetical protein